MTDDQKDLLKELVEAPYGQAEHILKAKGLWDEKAKPPSAGEVRTYRVRVDGQMSVSAIVKVEATSEEEAEEMAMDEASSSSFAWRDFGDTQVHGAEVEG